MKKVTVAGLLIYFFIFPLKTFACPEFLDVEMRKLGSKDQINFCEAYSGKTLLIVNTASNCGYAHQFTELERLHQRYKEDELAVIGFSSDDFFQEEDDEGDPELEAARAYARRRRLGPWRTKPDDSWERRQKELASMARAGFSFGVAKQALEEE